MKQHSAAKKADILHQASMLYMSSNIPTDYGTGEEYTSVEVHLLEYIVDHPGKTVTELSLDFDKTKAAISQMLRKIEDKGLIEHHEAPDSKKKQLYYATPKGQELNQIHIRYDDRVFGKTLELMKEQLRIVLARGRCKNISRQEVHELVDEIFDEYELHGNR